MGILISSKSKVGVIIKFMGRAPRDCTEGKACSKVLNGYPNMANPTTGIKRRVRMQRPRCEGRIILYQQA